MQKTIVDKSILTCSESWKPKVTP